MNKNTNKSKYDWDIHFVADGIKCDCCGEETEGSFMPYMCDAHTHGLDKYGSKELQVVLYLDPRIVGTIINNVGMNIKEGKVVLRDGMLLDGYIEGGYKIEVFETLDEFGDPVFRLILPDSEGRFPGESDEYPFSAQYYDPYILPAAMRS